MSVDRCVCHDVTFARLLELSEREGLDVDGLAARTGCSTTCGLCRPYIRLALLTKRSSLPVMEPNEIERQIAEIRSGGKRP